MDIKELLEGVKAGELSVDEAMLQLKMEPFTDIDFAKIDTHRKLRQGAAEVIYGAGKTPEQMIHIVDAMKQNGQETILNTRLLKDAAETVAKSHALTYYAWEQLWLQQAEQVIFRLRRRLLSQRRHSEMRSYVFMMSGLRGFIV